MKMLGIDYGEKRVGVAVSDEDGTMAFPKTVLPSGSALPALLRDMAQEVGIKHFVIGESRDLKGEANPIMAAITELKSALELLGFEVSLEPEYLTSVQAERLQGDTEKIDASAAAIILQSYLDRHRT